MCAFSDNLFWFPKAVNRLFSGHVFKQSGEGGRQSECDHSPPLVSVSSNPELFVQQTDSSWDTSWSRGWTHRYLAPQGTGPVVQATSTISRATEKSSGPCCARGLTWQQECPARVQDQLLESYVHSSCTRVVQVQEPVLVESSLVLFNAECYSGSLQAACGRVGTNVVQANQLWSFTGDACV